ncbi:MAG: tripartite tricarboxylate transporter TctB family protein [Pseudomonadota bacterium]
MSGWLRDAVVPLLALLGAGLYLLGLEGAHGSARRFPTLVIVLLVVLAVPLLVQAWRRPQGGTLPTPLAWLRSNAQRVAFVALAVAYYPAFGTLGFDVANASFLLVALPLAGLGRGRSVLVRAALTLAVTSLLVFLFRLVAVTLDLNLPPGLFGG